VEKASNGIDGIDGMAGPRFEVKHPNHSNSYVGFDRFLSVVRRRPGRLGGNGR
jgi:hypothetical protein